MLTANIVLLSLEKLNYGIVMEYSIFGVRVDYDILNIN